MLSDVHASGFASTLCRGQVLVISGKKNTMHRGMDGVRHARRSADASGDFGSLRMLSGVHFDLRLGAAFFRRAMVCVRAEKA